MTDSRPRRLPVGTHPRDAWHRRPDPEFAHRLGAVIRARRRELGLTQTQLGQPMTKGFISELERGRSLPSLGALVLLADRLAVPVSYLLGEVKEGVKEGLPRVYTPRDENEHAPAARQER